MSIRLKSGFLTVLLMALFVECYSQVQLKYSEQKKDIYRIGDQIELLINLKTLPETCKDGLDRAKIYVSGLKIENQTEWKKISATIWQKKLQLQVLSTTKKEAKLTILRKVDKENIFFQEHFKISN